MLVISTQICQQIRKLLNILSVVKHQGNPVSFIMMIKIDYRSLHYEKIVNIIIGASYKDSALLLEHKIMKKYIHTYIHTYRPTYIYTYIHTKTIKS